MDFVGNSEIQGTVPLPGSSMLFPSSFFFSLSFFCSSSTFPWIKKKSTQLPSTRHMVLCRIFFRVVHHPASPYFPPLDSGPFCTFAGPCPASGNVRIFFFSSFFDLVQSRPKRGVVDAEKKFIENLPNRREAGHNAPPWKCWTFRWFSDVKRRREWWLDFCEGWRKSCSLSSMEFLRIIKEDRWF